MPRRIFTFLGALATASSISCTVRRAEMAEHDHAAPGASAAAAPTVNVPQGTALPPGSQNARARLDASPRHGEWVMIRTGPSDSVRAWVVYPERKDNAPVVLVVHEIFGLSTWIRSIADQLAADGYIAIAPDLLTGKVALDGDTVTQQAAVAAIRTIQPADYQRQLEAVARYGMNLPAAQKKYGIVGFCWGGGASFAHAVLSPTGLGAAVVYYGTSPEFADLARVKVPVLGLYAGDDQRVDATIPRADSAMRAIHMPYESHVFDGAGHGFLRAQTDAQRGAANTRAAEQAWPLTVGWFRKYLGA